MRNRGNCDKIGSMSDKMKRARANAALLTVGAIWGGSFVVMKSAIASMPVNFILLLRFGVAALALSFFFLRNRERVNKRLFAAGGILGTLQYGVFALQNYGLMQTTAGKNALVQASYIVLVPFVLWVVRKTRPKVRMVAAALICVCGIGLLCLGGGDRGVNMGDVLTLISAVIYSVYIVAVDGFLEKHDMMQLTCVQFATAAVWAGAVFLMTEKAPAAYTPNMISELAYCCLLGTLAALTLQNVGIKYGAPETSALLLSTEAPFAVLFGTVFLKETMNGRMIIGCVLIIAAIAISQLNIKKKEELSTENG